MWVYGIDKGCAACRFIEWEVECWPFSEIGVGFGRKIAAHRNWPNADIINVSFEAACTNYH